MMILIAAAQFLVLLQPLPGSGGTPTRVIIEAHDANTAKRLATAQYRGSYRVIEARTLNERVVAR